MLRTTDHSFGKLGHTLIVTLLPHLFASCSHPADCRARRKQEHLLEKFFLFNNLLFHRETEKMGAGAFGTFILNTFLSSSGEASWLLRVMPSKARYFAMSQVLPMNSNCTHSHGTCAKDFTLPHKKPLQQHLSFTELFGQGYLLHRSC